MCGAGAARDRLCFWPFGLRESFTLPMIYEVDLVADVVLLLDRDLAVVDGFPVAGKTRHHGDGQARFYTYRSLLTPAGHCCLCGKGVALIGTPCVSSGGFHAFAGLPSGDPEAERHRVEHRSLVVRKLHYEEWVFYVEQDNLWPVSQIQKGLEV